jgi:hypothetical protein
MRLASRLRGSMLKGFSLRRKHALVTAFLGCSVWSAEAAEALYSQTSGATCRRFFEVGSTEIRCAGPAGYSSVVLEEGEATSVNFGRLVDSRLHRTPEGSELRWRGTAESIANRIEWRLLRGQPFAAIVQITTLAADGQLVRQFLVAKVTASGSCEIARIDLSESNARGVARDLADSQASVVECR